MKKINILLLFVLFFAGITGASGHVTDSLGIGIYKGVKVVMHKVTPKETFYSIARHYNVHPKYLIRFNSHIQGLKIGDTIRLEVDSMNNFQNLVLVPENDAPAKEATFPTASNPPQSTVTEHVVAPRETLFAIAQKYGLKVAELRALNGITDSHIETGQRLIVSASGPIASNPDQLSEVAKAGQNAAETGSSAETLPKTATEKKEEEKVYTAEPTPIMSTPDRMAQQGDNKKNKDLPKLVREVKESGLAAWMSNSSLNQAKSVALHNTAPSGTIIKVTNPATHRSVMVKVVGGIPQNAETENALIVISQAASQLLGIRDNRFRVSLSYAIQE
ncbi:LysM domain-containing protein [Anseongella ginsenosidimutans]|uniref:LysM domain-containing protein n=1 Tax=Anseongella ginsenosidimutans TaxID=496056 RepID=A0A4R3KU82_9SPHI|nr:LysM peptidoglycan-binding domain-containing protein [Anseongella ginsenosidimutans]QEC53471.1 LysM peptidoglycan-binding domain-containing protein [Anseongella ginsenosidimutans]TCS88363.1 LysM domain-containing protein [Anseongella ginsenosidimutans]